MCPIVRGVWNILHKCSVVENHIWFLQASTGLDWRVREEARGRAVVAAEGGTTRSAITVHPTKCHEHQEDQILRTSFQDGFSKKNLKTCFPLPSCYQVFKSGYCTNVYVYCNALIIFRFFPFFAWKCYFHFLIQLVSLIIVAELPFEKCDDKLFVKIWIITISKSSKFIVCWVYWMRKMFAFVHYLYLLFFHRIFSTKMFPSKIVHQKNLVKNVPKFKIRYLHSLLGLVFV